MPKLFRLMMLAGIPKDQEANREHYRSGCLAGLENKLAIEVNGQTLGHRAVKTYLNHFKEVHILGPTRQNKNAVDISDERVHYHDLDGRISKTLEAAVNLINEWTEPCVVVPNDLLPRDQDLETYLAATAPYQGLLVTAPIGAASIAPTRFPKRSYRVKTGRGVELCVFPQIWTIAHGLPLKPISAIADDFYRQRNIGAHRWGSLTSVIAGFKTYHNLDEEIRNWLRAIARTGAHLSFATRFPLLMAPSLHTAALRLGLIGLKQHQSPLVITEPIAAPSLAMDIDTGGEHRIVQRLHSEGWYDNATIKSQE